MTWRIFKATATVLAFPVAVISLFLAVTLAPVCLIYLAGFLFD